MPNAAIKRTHVVLMYCGLETDGTENGQKKPTDLLVETENRLAEGSNLIAVLLAEVCAPQFETRG